jgi:drug/metabolite transporter (DMT)-like permease
MNPAIKNILLATFYFSIMNVLVKMIDKIPAYEIVFFRSVISFLICFYLFKKLRKPLWGNNKKLLILRGIAGTIGLLLYFYTLQIMPLATAVTLQYLSPLFTLIIAYFMLKESSKGIHILFFILCFIGVYMIKSADDSIDYWGMSIAIMGAIASGFAYNFVRKLKDYDDPITVVFYFPLITIPFLGPYTIINWVTPSLFELIVLISIGVLTQFAQVAMTKAYQLEKFSKISLYNYLGPVLASVYGVILFNEYLNYGAYAGILIIMLSLFLINKFK